MANYILINGALRDLEELSLIIRYILKRIRETPESQIHGVIISTWRTDATRHPDFVAWAESLGVKFKYSEEINYGGPANYFRQMVTLDAGLLDLEDSDVVLKTRTDKALLRKDVFNSFIQKSVTKDFSRNLGDKLAIEHFSISVPFMAKDMVLLGTARTLRRAVSFTERTRYVAASTYFGMGPEVFMWLEYAKDSKLVMNAIRDFDFRIISSEIVGRYLSGNLQDWFSKNTGIANLYSEWIRVFESEFCFLSEILQTREIRPWTIDEGSWKYLIGDKSDLHLIKAALPLRSLTPKVDNPTKWSSSDALSGQNSFSNLSKEAVEQILSSTEYEHSDIVLIRRKVIKEYLSSGKGREEFIQAMKMNIRHRDSEALSTVKGWVLEGSRLLDVIDKDDLLFALEKNIELASLKSDWAERAILVRWGKSKGFSSSLVSLTLAETYYSNRKPVPALYWFFKSWQRERDSLGVNHGLGCVLLDLRMTRLAVKFLEKAHGIAPHDKIASWTLLRAYARLRQYDKAKNLLHLIEEAHLVEAERILRPSVRGK